MTNSKHETEGQKEKYAAVYLVISIDITIMQLFFHKKVTIIVKSSKA